MKTKLLYIYEPGPDGVRAGPLLIIAGAGTGKTLTLAHRVAHLVLEGTDPERLLLLTFSRRAAREMSSRARRIVARALAAIALMAGLFFLFAKPVPAVADGLVNFVLDFQGKGEDTGLDADDMPDLGDVPEHK